MDDPATSRSGVRPASLEHEPNEPPPTALETAIWILARGLWPIAITSPDDRHSPSPGKAPIGKGWARERPSISRLKAQYRRHPRAGVGIALGPGGDVVDLEVDDQSRAAETLGRLFPSGLPNTMGWRSARGVHLLFSWDPRLFELCPPAVLHLVDGSLELRLGAAGKQLVSVCPPSASEGGLRRTWNGCWDIATMPESLLEEVTRLLGLKQRRHGRPHDGLPLAAGKLGRYAAAAIAGESARVRQAAEGSRNGTLNRAAFRLGQLVGQGLVEEAVVQAALLEAAAVSGLGERESNATIRSGLQAGILAPRGP